jgi:hypothetical protein
VLAWIMRCVFTSHHDTWLLWLIRSTNWFQ